MGSMCPTLEAIASQGCPIHFDANGVSTLAQSYGHQAGELWISFHVAWFSRLEFEGVSI